MGCFGVDTTLFSSSNLFPWVILSMHRAGRRCALFGEHRMTSPPRNSSSKRTSYRVLGSWEDSKVKGDM